MLRSSRRSSIGSSLSLSSVRRSSVNPKDIERIQAAIQKKRQVSSQIILCFLLASPVLIFFYNFAICNYDGSLVKLLADFSTNHQLIYRILPPPVSPIAWKVVVFVVLIQFVFSIILPHDNVIILNTSGEREWRKVNGFVSCLLMVLMFLMGSALGFYNGSIIFSHWTEILSLLNLLSIAIVLLLYAKAQFSEITNAYHPIMHHRISNGSRATRKSASLTLDIAASISARREADPVCDIYYGTELCPLVFDVDVKHFLTYRVALTIWPLYIVSALYHCFAIYGKLNDALLACAVLQLTYIGKSHWFEHLYFSNLDAQIEKAGFCRLWGVLVFLPILYLTPVTLLAQKRSSVPLPVVVLLFAMGLTAIYVTTDIDRQRFNFRHSNGHSKVWGHDPFFISAKFRRENGEVATNLLLGSGWWSLSRHPNYLTEWLSFLFWTVLQGWSSFLSYLPLFYLALFLLMRMKRDETRCLAKYGQQWLQHMNRVPFLLIPSLY